MVVAVQGTLVLELNRMRELDSLCVSARTYFVASRRPFPHKPYVDRRENYDRISPLGRCPNKLMELEPGDKKSLGIGHVIANLHVCKIIDFLRLSEASSSPTGHQRPSVDAYFRPPSN